MAVRLHCLGHMPDLSEFTTAIRRLGSDMLLAPGLSGNASIKYDGTLWITASGARLRDVGQSNEDLVPICVEDTLRRLRSGAQCVTGEPSRNGRRPSVETWMHAVIPQKVVIHLQAVNTVACSIRSSGADYVAPLLDGLTWAWIPYTPSGRPLARRIFCLAPPPPQLFVLANHGLVVAADEVEEAVSLVAEVECRLRSEPRPIIPPLLQLLKQRIDKSNFAPARDRVLHTLATDPVSLEQSLDGSLYPCHWMYAARHTALACSTENPWQTAERFHALQGYSPSAILVPGDGVLVRTGSDPEVREQIAFLAEVRRRLPDGAPIRYLSEPEIAGLAVELGIAAPPPPLLRDPELTL